MEGTASFEESKHEIWITDDSYCTCSDQMYPIICFITLVSLSCSMEQTNIMPIIYRVTNTKFQGPSQIRGQHSEDSPREVDPLFPCLARKKLRGKPIREHSQEVRFPIVPLISPITAGYISSKIPQHQNEKLHKCRLGHKHVHQVENNRDQLRQSTKTQIARCIHYVGTGLEGRVDRHQQPGEDDSLLQLWKTTCAEDKIMGILEREGI